jgi:hypothetical protein
VAFGNLVIRSLLFSDLLMGVEPRLVKREDFMIRDLTIPCQWQSKS